RGHERSPAEDDRQRRGATGTGHRGRPARPARAGIRAEPSAAPAWAVPWAWASASARWASAWWAWAAWPRPRARHPPAWARRLRARRLRARPLRLAFQLRRALRPPTRHHPRPPPQARLRPPTLRRPPTD